MEQCQKRTVLSNDVRRNKKRKKKKCTREKNSEKTREKILKTKKYQKI